MIQIKDHLFEHQAHLDARWASRCSKCKRIIRYDIGKTPVYSIIGFMDYISEPELSSCGEMCFEQILK